MNKIRLHIMLSMCTRVFLLMIVLAALCPAVRAQALSCSISSPTLAFGVVNVLSGSPSYASGNVVLSCNSNHPVALTLYTCLSVGTGSGGGTTSARTLSSGVSTLPVELRDSPGAAAQIGDGTVNQAEGPLVLTIPAKGTNSISFPLTGIIRPQGTLPLPGTYTSVFSGTQFQVIRTTTVSSTCAQVAASVQGALQGSLSVSATIANQCTVSATAMPFPSVSLLTAPVQSTATVTVTCNASTSLTVSLNNGAYGSGPVSRQMASGANRVTYGIYQDSARTLPWGAVAGSTASLSVTGTASGSLTAYGLVPSQSGSPPGAYSDVVGVTINY